MAGFDNEVLFSPGERLEQSGANDITTMQKGTNSVSNINYSAFNTPEGHVAANPSSLSHDPLTGFLWLKVSGTGTTLWQRLFPSPTPPILSVLTKNATPQFNVVGTTSTVDFGITNLALGSSMPAITTATANVGVGLGALASIQGGSNNVAIGFDAGTTLTSGSNNVAIGQNSLIVGTTTVGSVGIGEGTLNHITTGQYNTAVGFNALGGALSTGTQNTALGKVAGNNYTTSESSNIVIGSAGVTGESNVIRIGTAGSGLGQQNEAFVAGITGVTVASSSPVAINSLGQLSDLGFGTITQVLTSNGDGNSPTWQPITTGGFTWNVVTSATNVNTVVKENGYIPKGGSQVIFILPAAAVVGDLFIIAGYGNLWTLTQNANQSVTLGILTTTVGVLGSITATQIRDTITVVCVTANTEFQVLNSVGNPNIV